MATGGLLGETMKDGMRFVDCDMHVMEPADLFANYLDPKFADRVISNPDGRPGGAQVVIDGLSRTGDEDTQQYRKRARSISANERQPLSGSRSAPYLGFAIESGYDAIAQVKGMEMEGVDIAVLFPTMGLSLIARDGMDPLISDALCRAYNNTTTGSTISASTAPTSSSSRPCCHFTT